MWGPSCRTELGKEKHRRGEVSYAVQGCFSELHRSWGKSTIIRNKNKYYLIAVPRPYDYDYTPLLDDFMHRAAPPTRGVGSLSSHGPIWATLRDRGSQIRKSRPALVVITPHVLPVETRSEASNGPRAPH